MAYFDNIVDLQTEFHTWIDTRFNSRLPDRYEKASECFRETSQQRYWFRFDQWIREGVAEGNIKCSEDLRTILWGA